MQFILFCSEDKFVTCHTDQRRPLPGDLIKVKSKAEAKDTGFIIARISEITDTSISWNEGSKGVHWLGPGEVSFSGGSFCSSDLPLNAVIADTDIAVFWTFNGQKKVGEHAVKHHILVPVWSLNYPIDDSLEDGESSVLEQRVPEPTVDSGDRFSKFTKEVLTHVQQSDHSDIGGLMHCWFLLLTLSFHRGDSPSEASSALLTQFSKISRSTFEDYIELVSMYHETLGDQMTEGTLFSEFRRLREAFKNDIPAIDFRMSNVDGFHVYEHLTSRLNCSNSDLESPVVQSN